MFSRVGTRRNNLRGSLTRNRHVEFVLNNLKECLRVFSIFVVVNAARLIDIGDLEVEHPHVLTVIILASSSCYLPLHLRLLTAFAATMFFSACLTQCREMMSK